MAVDSLTGLISGARKRGNGEALYSKANKTATCDRLECTALTRSSNTSSTSTRGEVGQFSSHAFVIGNA